MTVDPIYFAVVKYRCNTFILSVVMSITFIRCSDDCRGVQPVQSVSENKRGHKSLHEKLGLMLVYGIGFCMVLLQLRSLL